MSPPRRTVIIEDRSPEPEVRQKVKVYSISNPRHSLSSNIYNLFHPNKTRTRATRETGTYQTVNRSRRRHSTSIEADNAYVPDRAPPPTSYRTPTRHQHEDSRIPPPCPDPPRRTQSSRMSPRTPGIVPLPPRQPPLQQDPTIEDRRPDSDVEDDHQREGNDPPRRRGSHRGRYHPTPYEVRNTNLETSNQPRQESEHYVVHQSSSARLRKRAERLSEDLDQARRAVERKTGELDAANAKIEQLQRSLAEAAQEGQKHAHRADQAEERVQELRVLLQRSEDDRRLTIREREAAQQQLEGQQRLRAFQATAGRRDAPEPRDQTDTERGRNQQRPRTFNNGQPDAGLDAIRSAQRDRRRVEQDDDY